MNNSKYRTEVCITDENIKPEKLIEFTEKFGLDKDFEKEISVEFSFSPGCKGKRAHPFDQPDPDDPAEVEVESYTINEVSIDEYLKDDFKVDESMLFEVAIECEQDMYEEAMERRGKQ